MTFVLICAGLSSLLNYKPAIYAVNILKVKTDPIKQRIHQATKAYHIPEYEYVV